MAGKQYFQDERPLLKTGKEDPATEEKLRRAA